MPQKIEFIESYIRQGNDYQWNDNHGELIRCHDCKYLLPLDDGFLCMKFAFPIEKDPEGFCDKGKRRETE